MRSYKDITGAEWALISIANEAGFDKLPWEQRIEVGVKLYKRYKREVIDKSEEYKFNTKEDLLLLKRCNELYEHLELGKQVPNIYLDATASGLQIMSAITLDLVAGEKVNLGTSERKDVYVDTANGLEKSFGIALTRDEIKKPLMTFFYNSIAKIEELLGEENAEIFITYLKEEGFTGPVKLMDYVNSKWEAKKEYKYRLPDMVVRVPIIGTKTEDIKLSDGTPLPFTYKVNEPDEDKWRGMVPNIVHSLDAWILREVIRELNTKNIIVHTIHDSFQVSVNNAVTLIDAYKNAFVKLVEEELIYKIFKDLYGVEFEYDKEVKTKMIEAIKRSEYMLS